MSKNVSVESILKRLQEITEILEKGELPLEKSLKLYEEGVGLTNTCRKMLNEAEIRITELSVGSQTEEV